MNEQAHTSSIRKSKYPNYRCDQLNKSTVQKLILYEIKVNDLV